MPADACGYAAFAVGNVVFLPAGPVLYQSMNTFSPVVFT